MLDSTYASVDDFDISRDHLWRLLWDGDGPGTSAPRYPAFAGEPIDAPEDRIPAPADRREGVGGSPPPAPFTPALPSGGTALRLRRDRGRTDR